MSAWQFTAWAQNPQGPGEPPKTSRFTEEVLPSYEGQNVTSVELAGRPGLNPAPFESLLAQRPGQPFSRAKVDQSIAALKRTGKFENVQLQVRPEPGGVRVLLVLQPATYFGIYEFPGALGHFAFARLLQVTNYPPRGVYTPVDVQNAQNNLQRYFRRSGYFLATVETSLEPHPQFGISDVIFHVNLGRRAKFGNVIITGTTPQESNFLRGKVHSILARLRGSAIRPGKTYKLKTLQNASRYIESALNGQGHLAAKVRLIGANYNPRSNRADVSFQVQTGPIVHVKVLGAHIWSWDKTKLLPVYAQIGVDPELIQEGRQNLISYMQSKGYFDVQVASSVQQQSNGETILYQITKGPRHKVGEVTIAGNRHMPNAKLMPHVAVKKAGRLWFEHGTFSQKLVHTSATNLENIYKAAGYSSVKVTPQVSTHSNGNVLVTFQVDEGPQDIVESLRVQGNDTVSVAQLAPHGLLLAPGQPYSQRNVNQDRNRIMASYLELGFLTSSFRETVRHLPNKPHQLIVTYQIYEGPQVRTSKIVTLGRRHSDQELIALATKPLQPGKPLRENDMLSSESELYTSGVYDWAEIDPRRRITTQHQEDVLIKVHEAQRNVITYGFGFEVINRGGSVPSGTVALPGLPPVGLPSKFKTSQKTFRGPRGSFQYTRNDLRGKGESFNISGLAGRLDQQGSISYIDPNFRWSKWQATLSLGGEHNSENPIFTSRQAQTGLQFQRPMNPDKTDNLFLRYNFSETGLTRLLIPGLVPPSDRHVRLSTLSASFVRDTRDNVLDAHKGIYETYELSLNPGFLGSNFSFARLMMQTAYYKNIFAGIIWANSLRIGLEQPFGNSHVPLSERFFSGGGSTLRGFPLNGAGPQQSIPACGTPGVSSTCAFITVPTGGDQLFIVNSEFRIPINYDLPLVHKNLGIVPFYDGGNVYQRIGFHNFGADYTNSVGLGLRYTTPVGPIRIDLGHNLSPLPGIKATQFFVTIGQAF
ncbi:MAG TPA: POTRA domain-containing protein [Terriglobales bacterium]|nr:POTRA domain-containing protein [Terriglobales bacterium]